MDLIDILWTVVPISFYSSVDNFAPFFEVGIVAYLDRRNRICWLIPLMLMTFTLDVLICTNAFLILGFSKITGKRQHTRSKTDTEVTEASTSTKVSKPKKPQHSSNE